MNPKSAPQGANPPLNLDRFSLLANNDPAVIQQIITLYLSKTAEQLEELTAAVKNNSTSEIERLSHSIIGSSQMVGMVSWVRIMRSLESLAQKKSSGNPQALLKEAVAEFHRIREFLLHPRP